MKQEIEYLSNNLISIVEEEEHQLQFFENNSNIINSSISNKPVDSFYNKNYQKKSKLLSNSIEKKIELAFIQAGVFYTKPDQIIGIFENNPNFIIPKYKIAVVIIDDNESKKFGNSNDWNIFYITKENSEEVINLCFEFIEKLKQKDSKHEFTFVDLYAGIGGFRIPLEQLGGKCLGFSEIDKYAIETYKTNFIDRTNFTEIELGSVTNLYELPFQNIDLIVGGVPCQSWSVAGKMRGFEDPRGKLWNDTIRIIELNQPKSFIFENVKGLFDPRNKGSLELIIESFEKVGYKVKYKLLNSYDFELPQNRERIYIVGIRNDLAIGNSFTFPLSKNKKSFLYEIIEDLDKNLEKHKKLKIDAKVLFGDKIPMSRNRFQKVNELNDFFIFCDTRNGHSTIHSWDLIETSEIEKEICLTILKNRRKQKYGKSDGNPLSFQDLKELLPNLEITQLNQLIEKKILKFIDKSGYVFVNSKNSSGINGLYRIYMPNSNIFSTLTATGTKDVIALKNVTGATPEEFKMNFISEIINTGKYRSITARESGKLQGFPDWFSYHKDTRLAKKQFGNAVSINVIYAVAKELIKLNLYKKQND